MKGEEELGIEKREKRRAGTRGEEGKEERKDVEEEEMNLCSRMRFSKYNTASKLTNLLV